MQINFENFSKFKILTGTILSIANNQKARKPAYVLEIDFGNELGVKKNICSNYKLYYERVRGEHPEYDAWLTYVNQ